MGIGNRNTPPTPGTPFFEDGFPSRVVFLSASPPGYLKQTVLGYIDFRTYYERE